MTPKHILGGFLLTATLTVAANSTTFASTSTFHDVGNSYAKAEIQALASKGILTGYSNGTFKPSAAMTREEFAIVLAKVLNLKPDANAASKFSDVDSWAAPYVGALVDANITNGKGNGKFGGRDSIERQELATFLIKALNANDIAQESTSTSQFKDDSQVASWAKQYVALSNKLDLFHGSKNKDGSYSFLPTANADRQSIALLGYQMLQNMQKYSDAVKSIQSDITQSQDILTKTATQMDAFNSMHMAIKANMNTTDSTIGNLSLNMSMDADMQKNPMLMHGTMNIGLPSDPTDPSSSPMNQTMEMYFDGKTNTEYMNLDGQWTKTSADTSAADLGSLSDSTDMEKYKALAPLLSVQDQGDTYSLTGTVSDDDMNRIFKNTGMPDIAQIAGAPDVSGTDAPSNLMYKFTYVIDKQSYNLNDVKLQVTADGTTADANIAFSQFDQVSPITIPQNALDATDSNVLDSTNQDSTNQNSTNQTDPTSNSSTTQADKQSNS